MIFIDCASIDANCATCTDNSDGTGTCDTCNTNYYIDATGACAGNNIHTNTLFFK